VDLGSTTIEVATPTARATVTRAPFRLSIADGAGRGVLDQVVNDRAAPLVDVPVPSPIPGGSQSYTAPALYQPFSFTVGDRADAQVPAGQWEANQLAGLEAGVQYSAREVIAAKPDGDGVDLTLSTSDPTGRTLSVRIAPGPGGAIRVSARPVPATGVAAMADSFATTPGQPFHGFGGRHNALDQRGSSFYNWVAQQNVGPGAVSPLVTPLPGAGGDRYEFPAGPQAAYYVQSEFVSDRYGFLLDRDELSHWRLASDRPDAWQVAVATPALDYTVVPGEPSKAIAGITAISGRHEVPPEWGLGPMLDRLVRYPSEGADAYKHEVQQDIADIDRYHLPLTGYRIEAWQYYTRDELRQVIRQLSERGIKALLYFRSFVGQDTIGTDSPSYFDEARSRGYLTRTAGGQPYVFVTNFNSPGGLIDFTNPDAVKWWQGRIREALDLGASGFMQDFGEQVQDDMHFADGSTGATMHNRYPVLFHRATRQAVDAWEREHPDRPRVFWYTRSGYSGSPGSAAYEMSNFPGDATTDWSHAFGLQSIATDMLNRGVGGAYGYNQDIGGYFDVGPYSPTTKELFIRWAELAVFTPVFRLHGSVSAGTHTPWSYDAETVRIYNALSQLHTRARPLIMKLWREAAKTGMPVTRPLWLAAPGDAEAAKQDQEWLLGDDLLTAPVVEQGATSRDVYFPRGCWQDANTSERHTGPGSARVAAPLDRLPWFVRCGRDPLGSASCTDTVAPLSKLTSARARSGRITASGTSRDRGCSGAIARVYVSLARVRGRACRFVTAGGKLEARARPCRRPVLIRAHGTRSWTLSLPARRLPPGHYRVQVRAIDKRGNKEHPRKTASARLRLR
jgi:sulfoquinovosidase